MRALHVIVAVSCIACGHHPPGETTDDADVPCAITVEWIGGPSHGQSECVPSPCLENPLSCACAAELCHRRPGEYYCLNESVVGDTLRCFGDCEGCGPGGCGANPCRSNQCMGEGEPLRFELSWTGDADLDLHLVRGDRDTPVCDWYWDCFAGHASTNWDATWSSAPGEETIRVASTLPGEYIAYVHAKGDATNVQLRVTTFSATETYQRAQLAAGSVWAGPHAQFEFDWVDCGLPYSCQDQSGDGVVAPDTGLAACVGVAKWYFPFTKGYSCQFLTTPPLQPHP